MKTEITKCSDIIIDQSNKFSAMNSANKAQHFKAWATENPVARMIEAWAAYADIHADRFYTSIGLDYVLGDDWLRMGCAIRGLLNGELGGLDAGTLDGMIVRCLEAQGFKEGKDW